MKDHVAATIVRANKDRGSFAIRDLSSGGARLVGPQLDVFESERIQLVIELDEPVTLLAKVTRVDRQRSVVEVEFRGLDPDAAARIERSIADLLARVRESAPPTVLVIHPTLEVSSALERDLARVGVAARIRPTLATLVDDLADHAARFTGVVVAGSFGDAVGAALEYVETHHADLRRVLLFGDQIQKIEHPAASRVHAVLRTPWHFKGLARALELAPDSVVTTYAQLVALQDPNKK
ncbi:MAG: PilZ domain-containing protein [Myxococcota bacterium]|nr:PilZ domain-containing protein [Myxococcota bacterium]